MNIRHETLSGTINFSNNLIWRAIGKSRNCITPPKFKLETASAGQIGGSLCSEEAPLQIREPDEWPHYCAETHK